MIEAATFHVMTTELVVGSFALAGFCFVLHSFFTFLSTAGGGLALGVLFTRWRMGDDTSSRHLHNAFGSISTGCMLLTASLGGTYSRADSLTEFLPFVKENTLLLPAWMSIMVILLIFGALIVRQTSAVKHG